MEYMVLTMLYGFNEFDCEVFIPDLDKVVMHGNTIKFDVHVLKMLNEKCECEIAAGKEGAKASVIYSKCSCKARCCRKQKSL